jgi:hypothetical protein
LQPWRHYAVLDRDHGNMQQIVELLRRPDLAGGIIRNAYQEIACSGRWSHAAFARHVARVIAEEAGSIVGYTPAQVALRLKSLPGKLERARKRQQRKLDLAITFKRFASFMLSFVSRVVDQYAPPQAAKALRVLFARLFELVRRTARKALLGA